MPQISQITQILLFNAKPSIKTKVNAELITKNHQILTVFSLTNHSINESK